MKPFCWLQNLTTTQRWFFNFGLLRRSQYYRSITVLSGSCGIAIFAHNIFISYIPLCVMPNTRFTQKKRRDKRLKGKLHTPYKLSIDFRPSSGPCFYSGQTSPLRRCPTCIITKRHVTTPKTFRTWHMYMQLACASGALGRCICKGMRKQWNILEACVFCGVCLLVPIRFAQCFRRYWWNKLQF